MFLFFSFPVVKVLIFYLTNTLVILFSINNVHSNSPLCYGGYFSYETVTFHHADDQSTNEFTPNDRRPISSVLVIPYHNIIGVSYPVSSMIPRISCDSPHLQYYLKGRVVIEGSITGQPGNGFLQKHALPCLNRCM